MKFVGACGGRDYQDATTVRMAFDYVATLLKGERIVIVTGAARGADSLARAEARRRNWDFIDVPAMWDERGKSAGPRRNDVLAALPLTYMVVFPGGVGTSDMRQKAYDADIEVLDVERIGALQ